MSKLLATGAFAWLLLLGSATWARVGHQPAPEWTRIVYTAAGLVCHQRPDRSFRAAGVPWPVCGRCSGLYLAAPIGALVALRGRRRPARAVFLVAAIPTVVTMAIEWTHLADVSNTIRAAAALPLGAAIAWLLVGVTRPRETQQELVH